MELSPDLRQLLQQAATPVEKVDLLNRHANSLYMQEDLEVARYLAPIEDNAWETLGMLAFTVVILAFSALNFTSIALTPMEPAALQLRRIESR